MDDSSNNLTIIANDDGTINIIDNDNCYMYTKCYPLNIISFDDEELDEKYLTLSVNYD